MLLADVSPKPAVGSIGVWIALAVLVLGALLVFVVMRPLRGWRRFAERHRLTREADGMHGEVAGRPISVTLDRLARPPRTRVVIGAWQREAPGRASEAWLEQALADAAADADADRAVR
ncbi:MAG: hypothetical protein IT385_28335 [Deltaproteobacteria bacterium]|nr:hypothetical protein [Deltaproteobacteria bacterium]